MRKIFTPRSDATNRHRKDLRTLDPESPEYWNEILRREGLSMSAGADRRLVTVGQTKELELIERHNSEHADGIRRTKPKQQTD